MIISKEKNSAGNYEYHLVRMGSWEFFSDFSEFFKQQYSAIPLVKDDGIYTRLWKFSCGEEEFYFEHHEDIGNWFYSSSGDGQSNLLDNIANDISSRINGTD